MTHRLDDTALMAFVEESLEHLVSIEHDLLEIEQQGAAADPDLVNKVFRSAHTIKGGAGFLGLQSIKELAHRIENILDMMRNQDIEPIPEVVNILLLSFDKLRELVNAPRESADTDVSEYIVSLTGLASSFLPESEKQALATMVDIMLPDSGAFEISEFDIAQAEKSGNSIFLVEFDLVRDIADQKRTPMEAVTDIMNAGTLLESRIDVDAVGVLESEPTGRIPFYILFTSIIDDTDVIASLCRIPTDNVHRISGEQKQHSAPLGAALQPTEPFQDQPFGHQSFEPEDISSSSIEETVPPQPEETLETARTLAQQAVYAEPADSVSQSLRVNVNLLESLMNLASELVLSRNQLMQAIDSHDMKEVEAAGFRVNAVTSELQEAIMQTRMQPAGNLFNKFPRMIRDLSLGLGKNIELVIRGDEVELDKTILEGLSDPLTHLLRNAVDHGIELPEKRRAKGKHPTGRINLRAFHKAGQVLIELQDDGNGIDVDKLVLLALDKRIVHPDAASSMSLQDKFSLIFQPGLSTAGRVSDISGRGVGMDVVKTNLNRLGGQIELFSEQDIGTTIRIKLPLTLAIIPSLLASAGGQRFAVPQVNVLELVRLSASQVAGRVERVGDAEVLLLRNELIPLIRLVDLLGISRTFVDPVTGERKPDKRQRIADRRLPNGDNENGLRKNGEDRRYHASSGLSIIAVEAGNYKFGLIVDELFDSSEIVVKPLGRHLKHCRGYAGATIMGDGSVALILDVAGLAGMGKLSLPKAIKQRESTLGIAKAQERQYLIFQVGNGERCAAPLEYVNRVEPITRDRIEYRGGLYVMQHRGHSLPVMTLDSVASVASLEDQNELVVIVFSVFERSFGLIGAAPVDSYETTEAIDRGALVQPGIQGSLVMNDQTTMVVDFHDLVRTLHPQWADGNNSMAVDECELPSGPCILLVEDSDFFREQLALIFTEQGYRVELAVDGQDALDRLEQMSTDISLVVTDIEMPEMNGYDLAMTIKENERFADLPVIAVTSLASDDDIIRGQASGIDEYLIKLDKDKLLERVAQRLEQQPLP